MLHLQTLNQCSNFHPPPQIFTHIIGFKCYRGILNKKGGFVPPFVVFSNCFELIQYSSILCSHLNDKDSFLAYNVPLHPTLGYTLFAHIEYPFP